MSPNDTDNGINKDLGDEKLSSLYREAAHEEPPMKLDSAILSEARKAVERRVWWKRSGWIAPLATTGVAILTVSLVIHTKQEHPEMFAPPSLEETAPARPALKSAEESREPKKDELRRAESGKAEKRKATALVPSNVPEKELKKDQLRQREVQDVMKRKSAAPANLMENRAAPAPATAPNRLTGSEPSAAGMVAPQQEFRGQPQIMEPATNRTAGAVAPAARPAMPPEEDRSLPPEAASNLTPEVWIERIKALLKQGKKDEALRELETFKTIYPDYELPAELASLKQHPE